MPASPLLSQRAYLGFDVGGTKTVVALANAAGEIFSRERHPTPRTLSEGLELLMHTGERLAAGWTLGGMGVAIGGPLDHRAGIVSPLHQPEWRAVPLKQLLEARFGCPLAVDVDTNVAALGEWHHDQRRLRRFLYLTVSTGIGAGFVLDGELYRGGDGAHPEAGHQAVPLHPAFPAGNTACACGAHGCLESLVSGTSIRSRFGRPAEKLTENEWTLVTWQLAQGLRNLVAILAPECISLGGGVCLGRGPRLIDELGALLRDAVKLVPLPELRLSVLDHEAPLRGAILLAMRASGGDGATSGPT